jgi:hypothetical protein
MKTIELTTMVVDLRDTVQAYTSSTKYVQRECSHYEQPSESLWILFWVDYAVTIALSEIYA